MSRCKEAGIADACCCCEWSCCRCQDGFPEYDNIPPSLEWWCGRTGDSSGFYNIPENLIKEYYEKNPNMLEGTTPEGVDEFCKDYPNMREFLEQKLEELNNARRS